MSKITHEELIKLLSYEPTTGEFKWLVSPARAIKAGSIAGTLNSAGYRVIRVKGQGYFAQVLAWFYIHKVWPEVQVDHKDLIKDHNWLENLREATPSQNKQNMVAPRVDNKSGYLGVHWKPSHNKWVAKIVVEGKTKFLGYFDDAEEASRAYKAAKKLYHPFSTL